MKRANFFKVTNNTLYPVLFTPKDNMIEDYEFVIPPQGFVLKEWHHFVTDLDTWYFKFMDQKKKISVDDAEKHGIFLEYRDVG